ncbi:substrate binding domain-containing protein, partial [Roseateles sp. GG27B]
RGNLRVLTPPGIAVHQLAKHLPKFRQRYPQVTLELHSPGAVTTMDESFDLTILQSREDLEGDFVARRLARTEVIMCASPEYLDRRGRPLHPDDLLDHDGLLPPAMDMQRGLVLQRGGFAGDGVAVETVTLAPSKPALSTGHLDTNYAAALSGLGVAGLPSFLIEDALQEHALERVLPEWRLYSLTIWAAIPSRKYLPARTRVFLDFLLEIFGGEDRDPWLAAAGCETRN